MSLQEPPLLRELLHPRPLHPRPLQALKSATKSCFYRRRPPWSFRVSAQLQGLLRHQRRRLTKSSVPEGTTASGPAGRGLLPLVGGLQDRLVPPP